MNGIGARSREAKLKNSSRDLRSTQAKINRLIKQMEITQTEKAQSIQRNSNWTPGADDVLMVARAEGQSCDDLTKLFPLQTEISCRNRYDQLILHRRSADNLQPMTAGDVLGVAPLTMAQRSTYVMKESSGVCTPKDDQALKMARAAGLDWQSIQQKHFPYRYANACRKRHERLMEQLEPPIDIDSTHNMPGCQRLKSRRTTSAARSLRMFRLQIKFYEQDLQHSRTNQCQSCILNATRRLDASDNNVPCLMFKKTNCLVKLKYSLNKRA